MGQIFRARAHSKVNLHLGVAQVRGDGYHELSTVFQSLDIHDDLTLELLDDPTAASITITVDGPYAAGVPTDSSNLVWRAVELVARRHPPVALHVRKGIPAAGGMAGGSADAAAALRLANAAFAAGLSDDELMKLAAQLGSDVPFTLMGGTALGTGRGEELVPMMARGSYTWAIITNREGLSTPVVFDKMDELRAKNRVGDPRMDTTAVGQALIGGDPQQLARTLANDLQPAALSLRPDLRKILESGENAGALAGIVSGSGPTCAFLCEDDAHAQNVIAEVTADNPGTRGHIGHAPAPGAELLD